MAGQSPNLNLSNLIISQYEKFQTSLTPKQHLIGNVIPIRSDILIPELSVKQYKAEFAGNLFDSSSK